MPLPLIPIAIGLAGTAAGTALHAWLTGGTTDPWDDKDVFNARMREMHGLALALNTGFSTCKDFLADGASKQSWKTVMNNFGKFYRDTGTLVYMGPNSSHIAQAKDFASKFFFWTGEYNRYKCGHAVSPGSSTDPYAGSNPPPEPPSQQNWAEVVKWGAIGLGGAFVLKTLSDLFRDSRYYR